MSLLVTELIDWYKWKVKWVGVNNQFNEKKLNDGYYYRNFRSKIYHHGGYATYNTRDLRDLGTRGYMEGVWRLLHNHSYRWI